MAKSEEQKAAEALERQQREERIAAATWKRTGSSGGSGGGVGRVVDILSTLICIGAGIYLLQYNAASSGDIQGTSWFEIIGHGMGVYFIGKGLFIARSTHLQAEAAASMKQLVELAGRQTNRDGV